MDNAAGALEALKNAVSQDDANIVARLLASHPELRKQIDEPLMSFDSPAITFARSRAMVDALLEAGADINIKSRWWAGGFGLLHNAKPELARYAIERGAVVDVHAAARLGMLERLRELVEGDRTLVHARGGDGQTPLHFAADVAVAEYLLGCGADIDVRDIDHESTPAQFMLRDRTEVARFLVSRGCQTDLLMAAAIGDKTLVCRHLDADPDCIRMSVSDRYFPKRDPRSGGIIYIWTLGQNKMAHDVARERGHDEVFQVLVERSPDELQLALAGTCGDRITFAALLAKRPGLMQTLSPDELGKLVDAAQNNNVSAVNLMLSAGWPPDSRGGHGGTALHWSAFHGNAPMAEAILTHRPQLELKDADFNATPLGWAIHGSEHGWYRDSGDYAGTVKALVAAGAKLPEKLGGSTAVKDVLRGLGVK